MKNLISTILNKLYRRARLTYRSLHEKITCITLFTCRDFLSYISAPKIRATNPQCLLKTEVVCDRSEPTVTFSLREYNIKNMRIVRVIIHISVRIAIVPIHSRKRIIQYEKVFKKKEYEEKDA